MGPTSRELRAAGQNSQMGHIWILQTGTVQAETPKAEAFRRTKDGTYYKQYVPVTIADEGQCPVHCRLSYSEWLDTECSSGNTGEHGTGIHHEPGIVAGP